MTCNIELLLQSIFELYGEHASASVARQQVEKLMKKLDKDKNGLISEAEFVNGKFVICIYVFQTSQTKFVFHESKAAKTTKNCGYFLRPVACNFTID